MDGGSRIYVCHYQHHLTIFRYELRGKLKCGGATSVRHCTIVIFTIDAYRFDSVADASFVQPFDHIKLPLNVLAGFIVFGWVPPGMLWVGSALIIASVIFVTHYERRQNPVKVLWEEAHSKTE